VGDNKDNYMLLKQLHYLNPYGEDSGSISSNKTFELLLYKVTREEIETYIKCREYLLPQLDKLIIAEVKDFNIVANIIFDTVDVTNNSTEIILGIEQ